MVNSILFIRIQHKMDDETQRKSIQDILPFDVLLRIMKHAPQFGLTCKNLYEHLPNIDRGKYPNLQFPSRNTNPRNLVEISNGQLTFFYDTNKYPSSYKWDGLNPSLHSPPTILPLCQCPCDFCNKTVQGMTMQGSILYGVLFVCPECQHGLTIRLKEILGESIFRWFDTKPPRFFLFKNRINIFSSRLPEIYNNEWHIRVQSRSYEDLVPLSMLKGLNEDVPP